MVAWRGDARPARRRAICLGRSITNRNNDGDISVDFARPRAVVGGIFISNSNGRCIKPARYSAYGVSCRHLVKPRRPPAPMPADEGNAVQRRRYSVVKLARRRLVNWRLPGANNEIGIRRRLCMPARERMVAPRHLSAALCAGSHVGGGCECRI